jgi:hypothetical protein
VGEIYYKRKGAEYYEDLKEVRVLQVIHIDKRLEPVENAKALKEILSGVLSELGITFWWGVKDRKGNTDIFIKSGIKLGEIKHDSFFMYIEELMEESEDTPKTKVSTVHKDYKNDDLSILIDENENIGEIMKFVRNLDDRIKLIEVKDISTGDNIEKGKRSVLLNVKHSCENFDNDVRAKILTSDKGSILK